MLGVQAYLRTFQDQQGFRQRRGRSEEGEMPNVAVMGGLRSIQQS